MATLCAVVLAVCGSGLVCGKASAAEPTTIEIVGQASAAKQRPPVPDGKSPIAAHHQPTICTQGEYDAGEGDPYNPTYGYYWSDNSKAWIARPRCYPRWGFLEMSPSQIVEAGKPVTMTAMPRDGSNSGRYAPLTGSISWDYIGTVIAGCGSSDLSCTILPDTMATDEWQWLGFHVSMPKTFYIADPGEFCAGQHICAGAGTNAWSFVGIPPKDFKGEIFGTVTGDDCSKPDCRPVPMPGVLVEAKRSEDDEISTTLTDAKGEYSMLVPKGGYVVTPKLEGHIFEPFSTTAVVNPNGKTKGKTGPIDFNTCAAKGDDSAAARAVSNVPCPSIDADYKDNGNAPVSFSYKGTNWKASGSPIVVSWGDGASFKSVGGSEAKKSFSGDFKLKAFYPKRRNRFDKYGSEDDLSCWGTIRAKQGKVSVEHDYVGPKNATSKGGRVGYLLFTSLNAQQLEELGGVTLKSGDLLCRNEDDLLKAADAVSGVARETENRGVYRIELYAGAGAVETLRINQIANSPHKTKCGDFDRDEEGHLSHYTLTAVEEDGRYVVVGKAEPGGCGN